MIHCQAVSKRYREHTAIAAIDLTIDAASAVCSERTAQASRRASDLLITLDQAALLIFLLVPFLVVLCADSLWFLPASFAIYIASLILGNLWWKPKT